MPRLNTLAIIKFLIFSVLVCIISLCPSINVISTYSITISEHDSQRLLELLLLTLVLLHSITFISAPSRHIFSQSVRYSLFIMVALGIISTLLATSVRHAMIEISMFTGLVYLTLFTAHLYSEKLIKWSIIAIWVGVVFYMVAFYVGYITANIFRSTIYWPDPFTGFSNIRSFNQYQLWTLGLITLPLLTFDFKKSYQRYCLHSGLACWWVLLFYSASRGALLACFIGLLLTAAIYRKVARSFIRLQLMYICTGFFSYQILFQLIPYLRGTAIVTGTIMRDTISDRIELWHQAANLIQNNPLFGIGPMHFSWYSPISAHPHNSVLQLMTEWGLPAALFILCITGYGLFCWLKKFNITTLQTETKLNRNLAIVLTFSIATNATYSLVDGVIVMPISQVMMFTMIGLMLGLYGYENQKTVAKKTLFKPVFTSVVLVTLVWSTLPEILQSANGSEKRFSMGYMATGPRIWLETK